jgi:hypothetical protein
MEHTDAIHLNADEVRADLNKDLGFTPEDRIEQARRMGALARLLDSQGRLVIVDFVCPTFETRKAFGKPDYLVWIDRIEEGRFADTNKMWEDPLEYSVRIEAGLTVEEEVQIVLTATGLHDWKKPTTLMLGRYQPWHEGHHALYNEAGNRTPQVLLGVRNTQGTSEKDPLSFDQVKFYIDKDPAMKDAMVVRFPNITNIVYGRDVGYKIEEVVLDAATQAISATQKRKEMGI